MSDPKSYVVGWICALHIEALAATALLDEQHPGPKSVSENDDNSYILGHIGDLNIVIATMPVNEYGTSSAAASARDMLHSFPNVRIGLMVGIGGGVPTRHDVRLGDIVISEPGHGHAGVLQYDFGKALQNQAFVGTGILDQPPRVLRTAMATLKVEHDLHGHQIQLTIRNAMLKNKRLAKKIKLADQLSDELYKPEVIHPQGELLCRTVCGKLPKNFVERDKRSDEDEDPRVHYGLIASGNSVIKDAILRDKLACEKDVMCFEMEAAGLMNHFPCLVIRGICDYADSHKNKDWQGYAAITAAAYAKELLSHVHLDRVEAEKKLVDVLSAGLDDIKSIKTEMKTHFEAEKTQSQDNAIQEFLESLALIDYSLQQQACIFQRQDGTGAWLLKSPDFLGWVESRARILFCPGIPGAGKTIMTSIIIEELQTRFLNDTSVEARGDDIMRYLDASGRLPSCVQGESEIANKMRAVIKKTVLRSACGMFLLAKLHLESLSDTLSVGEVEEKLENLPTGSEVYNRSYQQVLERLTPKGKLILSWIICSKRLLSVEELRHALATRPGVSKIQVKDIPKADDILSLCAGFAGKDVYGSGIRLVHKTTQEYFDKSSHSLFPDAHDNITLTCVTYLSLSAYPYPPGGALFNYATHFWAHHARDSTHHETQEAVRQFLRDAKKVDRTIQELLADPSHPGRVSYDRHYRLEAVTGLHLAAYFGLIDNVAELIVDGDMDIQDSYGRSPLWWAVFGGSEQVTRFLLSYGASIEIRDENGCTPLMCSIWVGKESIIKLLIDSGADTSAEDNLSRTPFRWAMRSGAESIIEYLALSGAPLFSKPQLRHIRERKMLENEGEEGLVRLILSIHAGVLDADFTNRFLAIENYDPGSLYLLLEADDHSRNSQIDSNKSVSYDRRHHLDYMSELVSSSSQVTSKTNKRGPLWWESFNGNTSYIHGMIQKGSSIEVPDGLFRRTPLSWAASNGHDSTVSVLLEHGAKIDSLDEQGRTPLLWAALQGHTDVVKLLLEYSLDVIDRFDNEGRTALFWAAHNGNDTIVELLVKRGAAVDFRDIYGRTPLEMAERGGHYQVTELLIEYGAEIGGSLRG
ncbi:uncharacterized protein JN550_003363 [Neoarthrinium moseri]|uniref:uncharacterized protein n=1 Tax=Neoarthrinium moseri TaxID=1658444 RepID=UPI001FDAE180|nr:uncharacterized protein JN550_003363 [Neoarthrinium moseri]KAI1873110.1 hypothetical protein JN550_003363 [Neoarthrinium moseri]